MSVLKVQINAFESHHHQYNPQSVNMLEWLTSDEYYGQQKQIMACNDYDKRCALKSNMPCIMPSLHFGEHTGLISLDIDSKDNPGQDMAKIKAKIIQYSEVAYCGQSVSGKGLWVLIPIADPESHLYHFLALEKFFERLRITIDASKKNVNALRYYAYDPSGYFNHDAEVFHEQRKPFQRNRNTVCFNNGQDIDVPALLEKHGWRHIGNRGERMDYCRPGKKYGGSGNYRTTDGVFYVFTSSTEFEPGRGYSKFSVYAILEHGGDFDKAKETLNNKISL